MNLSGGVTTTLILRIPEADKAKLQKCAEEQDMTVSQIVRGLVRSFNREYEANPAEAGSLYLGVINDVR